MSDKTLKELLDIRKNTNICENNDNRNYLNELVISYEKTYSDTIINYLKNNDDIILKYIKKQVASSDHVTKHICFSKLRVPKLDNSERNPRVSYGYFIDLPSHVCQTVWKEYIVNILKQNNLKPVVRLSAYVIENPIYDINEKEDSINEYVENIGWSNDE